MSVKKGKGKANQVTAPSNGTLWFGSQDSLDMCLSVELKLANMDPMELSEMRVKGQEMRSIMASPDDRFANHYMVQTAGEGRLAIVSIQGALMHHPLPLRMFGLNVTTYGEIQDAVSLAMSDPKVERVLLAVGSGGGTGGGLFRTSNFLERMGKIKPIDTFTDSMMGSAAYWLGANGQNIYAEPMADVGSIGVYVTLTSNARMNENFGVDVKVVRAGEYKALGHPDEPLNEKAIAEIQRSVDKSYKAFLEHTSSKRGQPLESFRVNAAEGRIFSGQEAVDVGLVDEIVLFDDLVEKLLQAKPKTGTSRNGRNQKMHEGSMNKLLKLMQEMGVSLSAEQQAALASGASLDSIGLAADVVSKLDAALAEIGDDEGDGNGEGGDGGETLVDEPAVTKPELSTPATGGANLSELISQITQLSADNAKLQIKLEAAEGEIVTLKASAETAQSQMTALKPLVAASINRMEFGMRVGVSSNLEALPAEALAQKFEEVKTKFETTFPVGQKSKTAAENSLNGEARKLPSALEASASAATKI